MSTPTPAQPDGLWSACPHCGGDWWPDEGSHGCDAEYEARGRVTLRDAVAALPPGHALELRCFNAKDADMMSRLMDEGHPGVRYETTTLSFGEAPR